MTFCLVTGDWHLGLKIGGYDFTDDIRKTAWRIINESRDFDLFVHLGDLFHSANPSPLATSIAIELIDDLSVPGVWLVGNHDVGRGSYPEYFGKEFRREAPVPDALEPLRKIRFRSKQYFPIVPGVQAIEKDLFLFAGYVTDLVAGHHTGKNSKDGSKIEGKTAQGLIDDVFHEASRSEDRIKAGFCHLDVEGAALPSDSIMRGGKLNLPLSVSRNFPFPVFNGHIHKAQTIPPNLWLPGSIIPTEFTPSASLLGYYIVEV